MDEALKAAILERFPKAVSYARGYIVHYLDIREVIAFLKDSHGFNFLRDITAVDWLGKRFEEEKEILPGRFDVIYQLLDMERVRELSIKCSIGEMPAPGAPSEGGIPTRIDARIKSIVSLYPAANFLEREIYDMMGIHFEGHPDLRRILLSDDWEGYPLRKDYPVTGYDMFNWQAHK